MGYILFSSEKEIFINANYTWNGIIEYSYDNKEWKEWNGKQIINNRIYMRGVNNEKISNYSSWIINGKNIKCQGNIENLLDYKSVINNIHPKMGEGCFACMFRKCDALIEAPQLSAIELSKGCYCGMFEGCTSLVKVSELHAQKLSQSCYAKMFSCCTSLTNVIMFSEAKLEKGSYFQMFRDCTSLREISPLLITEVPSFAVSENV